ncbi:hypothetical protein V2S66_28135 [Streptomyces sp. V4-01]|uniref:Gram-positive cocci surface proteins LPxTG domain-containing protein n=1 Tax=Actinacidiphila polyblastidii TaxID=3110430 RepID=A0ABU7PJ11_9ACTN|nr:hypothetical protein [Streptomyces sp. V4-01]
MAAAAGLAAGTAVLAGAGPAHAAGLTFTFRAADRYYIPTAHSAPDGDSRFQFAFVAADDDGPHGGSGNPAHHVEVTIDLSALAGKVTVGDLDYGCTAGGAGGMVVTCDRGTLYGIQSVTAPFTLTPLPSAPVGFAADIGLKVTASDAPSATRVMHAVIGRPHLVTQAYPQRDGLPPGSDVSFTPSFGNSGEVTTSGGFQVLFFTSGPMDLTGPRYGNCHYATSGSASYWCGFDQEIAPGTAYAPSAPISFRTSRSLMEGVVSYLVFPRDTQSTVDLLDPGPGPGPRYPETGTGPALGLTPVGLAGLTRNTGTLGVGSTQHADFQAIGGTVSGKPGDVVMVPFGVRNAGPGGYERINANPGGGFDVTMPQGLTVLSVFSADDDGEEHEWMCSPRRNAPAYHCDLHDALGVGESYVYRFQIRVDRAVAGAKGQVRVVQPTGVPSRDTRHANDVAPITVRVTGAVSGGSTSGGAASGGASGGGASAGGSASGGAASGGTGSGGTGSASGGSASSGGASTGGSASTGGGGLAATGADAAPMAAGLAAAALLAGAGVVVAVRRRG